MLGRYFQPIDYIVVVYYNNNLESNYMILFVIIAFIIGGILGYIFKRRRAFHGPNSNVVKTKVFEEDGKYYKFVPKIYICPTSIAKKKRKSDYPVYTYIVKNK